MEPLKMSKTKLVGLVMVAVWAIAFVVGYRKPILHLATGAALFMWWFQVLGAQPEGQKRKRNLGFRRP